MERKFKVDRFEFTVDVISTENEHGIMTCHIPAYDLIFGARDEAMIEKKAIAMVTMWLDFFKIK